MVTDTVRVRKPEGGRIEPQLTRPQGVRLPSQTEEQDGITARIQFVKAEKATPKSLQLATLPDDRLRMKASIQVEIEQEGEHYIARCDELNEYGYGESPTEAIEDLQLIIVELFWTLKAEQERLGIGLLGEWKHLREIVQER